MGDLDAAYSSFAADHRFEAMPAFRDKTFRFSVALNECRRFEPGLVLPVHVNPEDPDDFVLVW